LGEITRNGHVYSYKISIQELRKSNGQLLPTLTGWRDASTFPGFCGVHDKDLFAPLEDMPFIGSKEQCFLLSYRAIAREYYAKQGAALQNEFRHALSVKDKWARRIIDDFNQGVDLGVRDAIEHKKKYDTVLESGNWDSVRAVLIEFDGIFPIQCAGAFFPERDVDGRVVQSLGLGKSTPDAMNLTSFAADGKSYICFCWLLDSDASCSAYVAAVQRVPESELPAVIASVILQSSENCHFSPNWYDGIARAGQEWCAEQMRQGMALEDIPPPRQASGGGYFTGVTVVAITTIS